MKSRSDAALLFPDEDDDHDADQDEEEEATPSKLYCACCFSPCVCRSRARCVAVSTAVTLVILTGLVLLTGYVIIPAVAQHIMDQAQLSFSAVTLQNAQVDSVTMLARGHISAAKVSGIVCTVHPTDLTLHVVPDVGTDCTPLDPAHGCAVGSAALPEIEVSGNGEVDVSIASTFYVLDLNNFNAFGTQLLQKQMVPWRMTATLSVTVALGAIAATYHGITLDKTVSIVGLDNLPSVVLEVFQARISPDNDVLLDLTVDALNPSIVSIDPLGNLTFNMIYNGTFMGVVNAPSAPLMAGMNRMTLSGVLKPADLNQLNVLLSNYLSQRTSTLSAIGAPNGTASSIPLYASLLSQLELTTSLSPLPHPIAIMGDMNATLESFQEGFKSGNFDVPVRLWLHNPFTADISFSMVNLSVMFNETVVASTNRNTDADGHPINFTVPGNATASTPFVPVRLDTSGMHNLYELIHGVYEAVVGGMVLLGMHGSMRGQLGNLQVSPHIIQAENIPTCLLWNRTLCRNYVRDFPQWPGQPVPP